jgi:peroxiredoxin
MLKTHNRNVTDYLSVFNESIVILSILITFSSCQKAQDPNTPGGGGTPIAENGKAPGFTLNSLSGTQIKLSDYNNKIVVIYFFGYSCPPCIAGAPAVESKLVTPFQSHSDYQVLGLDTWNGNEASVQAFQASTGVSFPLLLKASAVASDYKTSYDKLLVIDKGGNIVFRGYQGALDDIDDVKQIVDNLLSK